MGRRVPRPRGLGVYDKPPLSHAALVARMQHRGLLVPDVTRRAIRAHHRLIPSFALHDSLSARRSGRLPGRRGL